MAKITLTEALAKYKLTLKKIDDNIRELSHYTTRDDRLKDPLEKSGTTSAIFITASQQSIEDLSRYAIKLKAGISEKNKSVMVDVGKEKMTVEDAIVWRRDIAPKVKVMYDGMLKQARVTRDVRSSAGQEPPKFIVNFDEKAVMEALSATVEAESNLDMQLSIVNATQVIEV